MEHQKMIEAIKKKKLFFTVTTGRSGTGYLAHTLNKHPKITATHEPNPAFHHELRNIQNDPNRARQFWLENKIPKILESNKNVYIETSHLICKGFLESLIELEIVPNLILINRNKRAVAQSMLKLNTTPGRTTLGLSYYLHPSDDVKLPIKNWENLSDYQLCYWYTLEIAARQKYYANKFKELGSKIFILNFEYFINSNKSIFDFVSKIELNPYHPIFWLSVLKRNKINNKAELKYSYSPSINYIQEENEIHELIKQNI
jgi:hypothetical protein